MLYIKEEWYRKDMQQNDIYSIYITDSERVRNNRGIKKILFWSYKAIGRKEPSFSKKRNFVYTETVKVCTNHLLRRCPFKDFTLLVEKKRRISVSICFLYKDQRYDYSFRFSVKHIRAFTYLVQWFEEDSHHWDVEGLDESPIPDKRNQAFLSRCVSDEIRFHLCI